MKKILLLAISLFCLSVPALADTTPDPSANPVLAKIQKIGAKFYFLGNREGMDGWFIVNGGQVQIAYATPDNKGALVGALFGQDGENITAVQISNLLQTNKEVAATIAAAQKEQAAIAQVGSPAAPATASTPTDILPSAALSPGERLMHDLAGASTVVIGTPSTPEILMIMDPRCPHCQATMKALHDSIAKGSVHLRMIPIGGQDTDNERAAAILLNAPNPMAAWDKYIAGDASALAGTPSPAAIAAIRANGAVVDEWKIARTPYLVYRGKDGKVKILQGEPDKVSTVLSDLGG